MSCEHFSRGSVRARTRIAAALVAVLCSATFNAQQPPIVWKKDYLKDPKGGTIGEATPKPDDSQAPTTPGNVTCSDQTTTTIKISWTIPSTDAGGSGLAGYKIYRGPVPVGSVTHFADNFTDKGLQTGTSYSYRVVAFDNARNHSAFGTPVSCQTQ